MSETIPIIDVGDYVAGRPGALDAVARQVHDALTTVGFFVLTGHDVPLPLIERTFAEARRFHALPMDKKLALKLNEHVNGYMTMGRYAVRTSDINRNDKGDLNEAFFIKRERSPEDPLRLSGRRFVGPNQWPDEDDLPGFRAQVLDYADAMDGFARRLLPIVAVALDLPPDWFDEAFTDSQFTLRLSHYPPVAAEPNQFGIAPHTDSNFMTFLAQTEVPGLQLRMPSGDWLDVPYVPGSFAVNSGDMVRRWTNGRFLSTPHRAVPPNRVRPLRDPVLFRAALRPIDRVPAELHRPRQPAALGADHLRRLAGLLVRRQLRSETAARGGLSLGFNEDQLPIRELIGRVAAEYSHDMVHELGLFGPQDTVERKR